ncbi:MAG: hypothetical protein CMQ40_00575 [Gammaproteobacteria bacterium]|nr:hypothetical protein [Gammaproteobacteria bacterium]
MSCGFGAVILLYVIIIQYNQENKTDSVSPEFAIYQDKINLLEQKLNELLSIEIKEEEARTRTLLSDQQKLISIEQLEKQIAQLITKNKEDKLRLQELQTQFKTSESKKSFLEEQNKEEISMYKSTLNQAGGFKEVLTGMRLGGSHILILLDSSASMLADDLVNVIRRRNMSDEEKKLSVKWQQGISFVEWIMEKIPEEAFFQVVHFNETASSAIPDTDGKWLSGSDKSNQEKARDQLTQVVPQGGTSLYHAFSVISSLSPMPDNVYLIVDGLPTMERDVPRNYKISSEERRKYFERSVSSLSENGPPINVILFPMEADPYAAIKYWNLADSTGGSFIQPQKGWPK